MGTVGFNSAGNPDHGQLGRYRSGTGGLQERKRPRMTQAAAMLRARMRMGMFIREGLHLRQDNGAEEQEEQHSPRTSAKPEHLISV